MKVFIIEGTLTHPELINDNIMKDHIAYSQKAMDSGVTLVSGLKGDESGGLFIMKSESLENVESYLAGDPLKTSGIQEYRVIEFTPHNCQAFAKEWFFEK